MQVKVEDISAVEKRVAVEIPWEHVRDKMNEAYRDLGRKVHLRGFRKGHVPREMLEKLYGKAVERDVARDLLKESFALAAHENDLHPVADPIVDDLAIAQGKPFRYSARFEIRTEFEPKDYEGLPLTRRPPKVTDEEVDGTLERRRQSQIELKAIEGRQETSDRDLVRVAIEGTIGDEKLPRRELHFDLGRPEIEPLPGLAAALRGLPLDATDRPIELDIPATAAAAELAGKKGLLRVSLLEAREKLIPALDDEFAKDTGEADTLADLRDKTRQKLLESDEKRAERELREQVVKELCKRNEIPIAPALIERQLGGMLQRARQELALQGIDPAKLDLDRMREQLRGSAEEEVRAALLLDAIAAKEKIEITAQDLDKRVAEIAALRHQHPAKTKTELSKNGQLEGLRYALREEKVLDLILSKATIQQAPPAGAAG